MEEPPRKSISEAFDANYKGISGLKAQFEYGNVQTFSLISEAQ